MKKGKQQTFEQGAFILIFSTAIANIIGAFFKIPLSNDNILSDLGFGYFSTAYDFFTPIYAVSVSGLPQAISRTVSKNLAEKKYNNVKQTYNVAKKAYFIIGLVCFALSLLFIFPYVFLTDSSRNSLSSLLIISPSIFLCFIISSLRGYYEGFGNMIPTAVSELIESISKLVLGLSFGIIAIKITRNYALSAAATLFGVTLATLITTAYLLLYKKKNGDIITEKMLLDDHYKTDVKTARKALLLLCLPITLSSLANNFALIADALLVRWQLQKIVIQNGENLRLLFINSISAFEKANGVALKNSEIPTFLYGLNSKAFTIYNLVPTLTVVFGVSGLPLLTSSFTKKDNISLQKNTNSVLKLIAVIALPSGLSLFVISNKIMKLLYSSLASELIGGKILAIYGITAIFASISIPMTSILSAVGKEKQGLINILFGVILKIVLSFFIVSNIKFNIFGAVYSTLFAYILVFSLNFYTLKKATNIKIDYKNVFIKPFISSCFCALSALLITNLIKSNKGTVFSIFIGIVVYFIMILFLHTFNEEEILSFPKGEKLVEFCKKYKYL